MYILYIHTYAHTYVHTYIHTEHAYVCKTHIHTYVRSVNYRHDEMLVQGIH